jgi:hypothetical protein
MMPNDEKKKGRIDGRIQDTGLGNALATVEYCERNMDQFVEVQLRMGRDLEQLKGSDLERRYRERGHAYFSRLVRRAHVLSGDELNTLLDTAINYTLAPAGVFDQHLSGSNPIISGESPMKAHTLTAERLHALAELYQQGQVSDLMARTLEKLLGHEAEACQIQLSQLQAELAEFEQKYHLSSTAFYQQFQAGQTGDDMDYVEWASLVQMVNNLEKRLRLLTGETDA